MFHESPLLPTVALAISDCLFSAYLRFFKGSPTALEGTMAATGFGLKFVVPVMSAALIYHVLNAPERVRLAPIRL